MNKIQAKFLADKFLSRFKDNYTLVNQNTLPVIEEILYKAGLEFNDIATDILEQSGNVDTGGLAEFSAPQVYQVGNGFVLEVGYPVTSKQAKYYDYINKGVTGVGGKKAKLEKTSGKYKFKTKKVSALMAGELEKWAKRASLTITTDKVDLSKTQIKRRKVGTAYLKSNDTKKLGFIISAAVKRDGIKANYYFDKSVKKVFNKDFNDSLVEALKADVTLQIRAIYGSNNS